MLGTAMELKGIPPCSKKGPPVTLLMRGDGHTHIREPVPHKVERAWQFER